jgi:peroxiredoxin Q/BCP
MNDTPICNRQLGEMSLRVEELLQWNARVFGVNTADPEKHKEYCVRKRLEFPILSDPGGVVAKKYSAWMRWLPIMKRTVVVIDPLGIVRFYKRGKPSPDEVRQLLESYSGQRANAQTES